jgi:hypothetical protein
MIVDNSGKPIGILTNLVSDKEVITVNAIGNATVITTRDRKTGKVETQILYGKNPLVSC